MKTLDEIKAFAKTCGYQTIVKAEKWHGYEVYEPVYADDVRIGIPLLILVSDDTIRLATVDETIDWLGEQPE